MTDVLTIPSWVPDGVRLMYEVGQLKNDCARRLLTDARMKPAWTQLSNFLPDSDGPTPSYHHPSAFMQDRLQFISPGCSPETYEIDHPLTDFDRLSAALYYQTVIANSQVQAPVTWTVAEAEAVAQPYLDAVKVCNAAIEAESKLKWGDPPRLIKEDLVSALKMTRDYLQAQGQMHRMASNPRVLDRRRSEDSDRLRAHARSIAVWVRDLFGPFPGDFPHAAVARILVVSLDRSDDLKALKKGVTGWCESLPTPVSTSA